MDPSKRRRGRDVVATVDSDAFGTRRVVQVAIIPNSFSSSLTVTIKGIGRSCQDPMLKGLARKKALAYLPVASVTNNFDRDEDHMILRS